MIIENLADPLNLGLNFLKQYNIKIIFREDEPFSLIFKKYGSETIFGTHESLKPKQISKNFQMSENIQSNDSKLDFSEILDYNVPFTNFKDKIFPIRSSEDWILQPGQEAK